MGFCTFDDLRLAQKGDREGPDRFLALLHAHLVKMVRQCGRQSPSASKSRWGTSMYLRSLAEKARSLLPGL